jgi:uncharacterized Zn finger protein
MRKLLGRVDDGRFGRAVAGLQAGWQWVLGERGEGHVRGAVRYGKKEYVVVVERQGRGWQGRCSCKDAVVRGVLCKHVAFAVLSELGLAAAARSAHKQLV